MKRYGATEIEIMGWRRGYRGKELQEVVRKLKIVFAGIYDEH